MSGEPERINIISPRAGVVEPSEGLCAGESRTNESVVGLEVTYVNGQFVVRDSDGYEFRMDDLRDLQQFFPRLRRLELRAMRAPCVTVRGLGIAEIVMADGECGCLCISECPSLETVTLDNIRAGSCTVENAGTVCVVRVTCGKFVASELDTFALGDVKVADMVCRGRIGNLTLIEVQGHHLRLEGVPATVNLGAGVRFNIIDGPGKDSSWDSVQGSEDKKPEKPAEKLPKGKSQAAWRRKNV
ncbi:MAG: hypothetical protein LBB26_03085 [Puniceicoccales bacterium]|jgi:hypothetical protein|nr:hypothetical protein [Puniceicoccales bacterium]